MSLALTRQFAIGDWRWTRDADDIALTTEDRRLGRGEHGRLRDHACSFCHCPLPSPPSLSQSSES